MGFKDGFDLTGKTIIVTGGSSGIGRQTAITLSELGAKIVLVARREEKLKETLEMLKGNNHSYYAFDLSKVDEIEGLIKTIVSECGKIYGLAYCAGIAQAVPIKMASYKYAENTMAINFFAFHEMVRQVTKKGRYDENAKIAVISSVAGVGHWTGMSIYGASKAAVESVVRILSQELMKKGIHINSVRPGWVNTDMYAAFQDGAVDNPEEIALQDQPLGIIEPEEVAGVIAFLMSDAARSITGQAFTISGGIKI